MSSGRNPISLIVSTYWRFSKGTRHLVIINLLIRLLARVLRFAEPLVTAWFLNTIQFEGVNQTNIMKLIGILALLPTISILFWCLHGPARILERKNAFAMDINYRKYLMEGTILLPLGWHTYHHSGDTLERINAAAGGLYGFADRSYKYVDFILNFVMSLGAIFFFNLQASYLAVVLIVIWVPLLLQLDRKLKEHTKQILQIKNRIAAKLYDIITNISTVITLRLENQVFREITTALRSTYSAFMKRSRLNEFRWFVVDTVAGLISFVVVATYIYTNYRAGNVILIGYVSALFSYINRLNAVFRDAAENWQDLTVLSAALENVGEITKQFADKKKIKQANLTNWKHISINNLSFSYLTHKERLHLSNINLDIKNGERIALIGESGSGKSTFLKLLRALYDPSHVEVLVDNTHVKGGLHGIESHITLIPQDPEIFETTIEENITLGINYDKQTIKKVIDMAQFTKVVKRLPKGLKSSIVEKGVNLSGGEKQRLALARGLLAAMDKPILLLDEPTSSVDAQNELLIYSEIMKKFRNKTIISAMHRLHLLPAFDRILMFSKGKLIASGTQKELMKTSKEFKTLWNKYHSKHK